MTIPKLPGVALGAGLASALLFAVSAKGTTAATFMAYFTALPIMIAAIGFGHMTGLWGALIGFGAVTVVLGPVLGAFYGVAFALPGWWLSYLSLLARPGDSLAGAVQPPALIWFPVSRIIVWAAVLASGAVVLVGAAILFRYGGYAPALKALSAVFATVLAFPARQADVDPQDLAGLVVRVLPLAMAASSFLMFVANLWLAGRISQMSERLTRPWPNVPDGLSLPAWAAAILLLGVLPALIDGPMSIGAATVAAAFGMAFALQGLATAHVLTRGMAARRPILIAIYLVTVLVMPWPLVALTLLGIVDSLFVLRSRRRLPTTPTHPNGGQPWK